jgi:hypothetical protein
MMKARPGDGEMSQDTKDFALVTGASSGIGAIYVDRLPSTAMQTTPITQHTPCEGE